MQNQNNLITNLKENKIEEKILDDAIKTNKEHSLKLNSIKNIRNYKNYKNTYGHLINDKLIYRSASLHNMTKEDSDFLYNIGIRTIIDLRVKPEIETFPDNNIEKFKYINCPLPLDNTNLFKLRNDILNKIKSSKTDDEKLVHQSRYMASHNIKKMYQNILFNKDSLKQINKIFKIIINEDNAILFHCASGKDRTGIISALFLCMLGVNQDIIEKDYYASIVYGFQKAENIILNLKKRGYGNDIINQTRLVLCLGKNSISKIINLINSEYENIDNYIFNAIKITNEDIDKLVKKYLINPNTNFII